MTDSAAKPAILLSTAEIQKVIPHRWPFLLVDRIVEDEKIEPASTPTAPAPAPADPDDPAAAPDPVIVNVEVSLVVVTLIIP